MPVLPIQIRKVLRFMKNSDIKKWHILQNVGTNLADGMI